MFKKPYPPPYQKSKLKSSIQRQLRNRLLEQFPLIEPYIDEVLPKKSQLDSVKGPEGSKITVYSLDGEPVFFQDGNEPLVPGLRVVHRFPQAFPSLQIDRGAIRFVLSGAALMVPGLISPGGKIPQEGEEQLVKGQVVAINAEGKENAVMVGILKMGTEEMRKSKKGVAVEGGTYLGDGLWRASIA